MLNFLRYVYRLVRGGVREHFVKGVIEPRSGRRSAKWPEVRKAFLKQNPACAACGGTRFLNVHHIQPFRLKPELELDTSNLITLCMSKKECHHDIGHGNDYRAYNPYVVKHAKMALLEDLPRERIEQLAKEARKYN